MTTRTKTTKSVKNEELDPCGDVKDILKRVTDELEDITKESVIFLTTDVDMMIKWATERIKLNAETRRKIPKGEQYRERIEELDRNALQYTRILEGLTRLRHAE